VRERDGYRCTECGMTSQEHQERYGKNLEVHRLTPGSPYTADGCVTLCVPCHGPKPKSPRGSCELATVKVRADVLRLARCIAYARGLTVRTYLESILAPAVDRDFQAMMDGLTGPPPSARP
jgi:hypothetical protein